MVTLAFILGDYYDFKDNFILVFIVFKVLKNKATKKTTPGANSTTPMDLYPNMVVTSI